MVERINFCDTQRFVLTYRNMVVVLVGLCVLCLMVHGGLLVETWVASTRMASQKDKLQLMQVRQREQQQLLMATQTQKTAGSAIQDVSAFFVNPPTWSGVVASLQTAIPDRVDLMRVSTVVRDGGVERANLWEFVQLEGYAGQAEAVAAFMGRLTKQPWYTDVTLIESVRDVEQGRIRFVVKARVRFGER